MSTQTQLWFVLRTRPIRNETTLAAYDETYVPKIATPKRDVIIYRRSVNFRHQRTTLRCELSEPLVVWEQFKEAMAEDFVFAGVPQREAVERALAHIQTMLAATVGKTTEEFGLPLPADFDRNAFRSREYRAELAYDRSACKADADSREAKLNDCQRAAYNAIMAAMGRGRGEVVAQSRPCFSEPLLGRSCSNKFHLCKGSS